MKNAPTWVVAICGTIVGVTLIAAFVVLSVTGSNADDFSRFINTAFNFLGILLGGGAWVTASSANETAHAIKAQQDELQRNIDRKDGA